MTDKRAWPRWWQRLKAEMGGYFWLPCPICGENFGGHEWAGTWMTSQEHGRGVCANCVDEASWRSRAYASHWNVEADSSADSAADVSGSGGAR